jgi:Cu/Ag efflux protein CusF
MHSMARIGRAAAAAALVVGVSAVTVPSMAGQGDPGQQGTTGQPSNKGQHTTKGQGATPSPQPGSQTGATPGAQAPAQPRQAEGPSAMAAETVTATATVEKIDKAASKVTLKDEKGDTFEMKAGPHVSLDQLKVGDRVTTTYFEEVAVALNRAGGAPKKAETIVQRGGVAARQATVTARVVSVDPNKNTVVIRGPEGNTHTLKVQDPDVQAQLKKIKPGEDFDVTYTQAVAMSVEPKK